LTDATLCSFLIDRRNPLQFPVDRRNPLQAFGAKQYPLLGVVLQRALVMTTLVSIPILGLWCFQSENILLALNQDATMAAEAAK
jgi:MatE